MAIPQAVEDVAEGASSTVGRVLIAPALTAALDDVDTRRAIRRIALEGGLVIGACITAGILAGRFLGRRRGVG